MRTVAGAGLGSVFVVGDVADPVDGVLDRPVAADPGGQLVRFGLVNAQVGDGVGSSGGEALRFVEPSSATADLQGLGGVGERDAGREGQDLQGAELAAAVPAVVVAGGVDVPPGQSGELFLQAGLVAFAGQYPVRAAFGEVGDVVTLAVQGNSLPAYRSVRIVGAEIPNQCRRASSISSAFFNLFRIVCPPSS